MILKFTWKEHIIAVLKVLAIIATIVIISLLFIKCTKEPLLVSQDIVDGSGNVYHPITIGNQTWLIENLKTTKYNTGEVIPYIAQDRDWANLTSEACCWYFNIVDNSTDKGMLYNWYSVATAKLCPVNYHVPSDKDWQILESALGMKFEDINLLNWRVLPNTVSLKSETDWIIPGLNNIGFSALPAGFRYYLNGHFEALGQQTDWWCTDEHSSTEAYRRSLFYSFEAIYRGPCPKNNGLSIRCIKN
jgi:uncharacterized protein (TIGR02145 family)